MRGSLQRQSRQAGSARVLFSKTHVQAPFTCRASLMQCKAVCPPPPRLDSTQAQDTAAQELNDVPQEVLLQEQKTLVDSIRDKSKRIRKMAKKVKKASLQKKSCLHEEMQCLVKEVHLDTDRLGDLIKRMSDAGFVDPDTSSSEDVDELAGSLDAASCGAVALHGLRDAVVTVCTGKACARKGQSESIARALEQHYGSNVIVQTCSCMSMCKSAANVRVELVDSQGHEGDSTTTVTGLSPELLEQVGVPIMQFTA